MNLSNSSIIVRIEFPLKNPIYLICKRIHWIFQYFLEISKYLESRESFIISLASSKSLNLGFRNLGTLFDLYSSNQVLILHGEFVKESRPEFKELFLQSLKESEFLRTGSVSNLQSLSIDQTLNLINNLCMTPITDTINFPIKVYIKDRIYTRKFSRDYCNESLLRVFLEIWPGHELMYFGVILTDEFKFSDTLSVLSPDNWFHVVLRVLQV